MDTVQSLAKQYHGLVDVGVYVAMEQNHATNISEHYRSSDRVSDVDHKVSFYELLVKLLPMLI
ncbi:hypothetical protein [Bacillus cereus]|uniref:hypothetical protein n=1 Tax=Bacillus cereus TaxID=1396 RepID=UPI001CD44239|nr:hypothetical protein [Bacillus cereus]